MSTATKDSDQLRDDIVETRRELGDTVEALVAKTDVKEHAKRKVQETKASARGKLVPVLAVAGALTAGVIVLRIARH